MMLILAEIPAFVVGLLVALFVIISVMMMLIVLIQRPQGGGLSEAFGSSSGSGHTAFGAKTGDALTYATITIFVVFIGFAVGLNYIVKPPVAVLPASGEVTTPDPAAPVTPAGTAPATPPATQPATQPTGTTPPPAATSDAPASQPAETAPQSPAPSEETPATPPKDE